MIKILIIILNIAIVFRGVAFATQMLERTARTVTKSDRDVNKDSKPPIDNKDAKNTQKQDISNKDMPPVSGYKSIMFSDKNIADITKSMPLPGAVKQSDPNEPVKEEISSEEESTASIDDNNVDIYLNSIMFISKNNWAIWLNGSKITNLDNGEGDIVVTSISPLRASFYWKVGLSRWEIINANKNIPNSKYKIEANEVKIYFSLSPNQTYIPSADKIVEGKIKREQIEVKDEEKTEEENNEKVINKNDSIFF